VNGLDVSRAPSNESAWNTVTMVNNIVVDNVSGYAGGGVAIVDALKVNASNNTIAFNDSSATSQQAFANPGDPQSSPQPAGLVSQGTSGGLVAAIPSTRRNLYLFSKPVLANKIHWHNRAGCWAITGSGPGEFGLFDAAANGGCNTGSPMGTNPVYVDLAVIGSANQGTFANKYVDSGKDKMSPERSILSALLGTGGYDNNGNLAVDPLFVASYLNGDRKPAPAIPGFSTTIDTAATSDEGGNYIDIRYGPLTQWNCLGSDGKAKSPQSAANCPLFGDYHLQAASPAIDKGLARTSTNGVPAIDYDGQSRTATKIDIGADEVGGGTTPPPAAPPTVAVLDNFNRANANTLGSNWNQAVLLGQAAIRVNANQAAAPLLAGTAFWNGQFGANQAAALTLAGSQPNGVSLLLKASGNFTLGTYANYVRVRYNAGAIVVDTTPTGGLSFANTATLASGVSLAAGDTLLAQCTGSGVVNVWKVQAGVPAFVGTVSLPTSGAAAFVAGTGRIGVAEPVGARIDDFAGGTVP
jgi:hypothetical protein